MTDLIYFLLFSSLIVQVLYFVVVFGRFACSRPKPTATLQKINPVSVVICAKNEADHLKAHLPKILNQDYLRYEVIVVDDGSTDDSTKILKEFAKKYQHLVIVSVKDQDVKRGGKRNALQTGILRAQHNYLLLTDTDCQPKSKFWIKHMVHQLNDHTDIVLGFSPYVQKPGFLNNLIRFETFQTGMQYLSLALIGQPYMGVGRNLAYKKSLFTGNNPFDSHKGLLSGDDDLFVNQNATDSNTAISIDPDAMMVSTPKTDLRSYIQQKRRHMTTGAHYKLRHQLLLGGFVGSQVIFYASLILALGMKMDPWILAAFFFTRLMIQLTVYRPAMRKLDSADIWILTPVLDIAYTLYYLIISSLTILKPIKTWK